MNLNTNFTSCTQSCYNNLQQPDNLIAQPFKVQKYAIMLGTAEIGYGFYKLASGINTLTKHYFRSTPDGNQPDLGTSPKKTYAGFLMCDGAANIVIGGLLLTYGLLNSPFTNWNQTLPPKCEDFCKLAPKI